MNLYLTFSTGVCTGALVIVLTTYYLELNKESDIRAPEASESREEDWQLLQRMANILVQRREEVNCSRLFQGDSEELSAIVARRQNISLNRERAAVTLYLILDIISGLFGGWQATIEEEPLSLIKRDTISLLVASGNSLPQMLSKHLHL